MSDILRPTGRSLVQGWRMRRQRKIDGAFWDLIHRHDWLQYDHPTKTADEHKPRHYQRAGRPFAGVMWPGRRG
jgi:hypothetical protein